MEAVTRIAWTISLVTGVVFSLACLGALAYFAWAAARRRQAGSDRDDSGRG